jgi:hypothetical protein
VRCTIKVAAHDNSALAGEAQRRRPTLATASSGDQRDFTFKTPSHYMLHFLF